jgi:hypothetical protein
LGVLRFAPVSSIFRSEMTSRKFQALGFVLTLLALATACRGGPVTVLAELSESNRLAADLRVQFTKATDASNRAVMAETDEASIAFARDADQTSAVVQRDASQLKVLLAHLGIPDEIKLLDQFQKRFSDYRSVDSAVLALAVENTNLKAQRLSFGPARDAADRFKAALLGLKPPLAAKDRCQSDALVAKAILAVRELQTLQGPHIASADDTAMTGIETQMATLETTTDDALSALRGLVEPSGLTAAQTAFTELEGIGRQIVSLSRRNSNVRSLDLSLRVKPPLAVACDDSLQALQQGLTNEGSKATR